MRVWMDNKKLQLAVTLIFYFRFSENFCSICVFDDK